MSFERLSPGTLLCPVPVVMVSCAGAGVRPNIITAAWVGTACSQPPMLTVGIRKERYSHAIIRDSGEFVINLVGREQLKATDYCGVKSGRDEDKFAACALAPEAVPELDFAPAIAQCPLYLGCKVEHILELGSHDLFIGRVVGMGVQKALINADGKVDLRRADLVAYSHGVYYALGEALGFFGYSVAGEETLGRRMRELTSE